MYYAIVLNILKFILNDFSFIISGSNRRLFSYIMLILVQIYFWFNNCLYKFLQTWKINERISDSKDTSWSKLFKMKCKCLKLSKNLHQVPPAFSHPDLSWYCPVRLHFPAMFPDVKTHPWQVSVIFPLFFQLLQLYPASLIVAMATTTRRTIRVAFCILILSVIN